MSEDLSKKVIVKEKQLEGLVSLEPQSDTQILIPRTISVFSSIGKTPLTKVKTTSTEFDSDFIKQLKNAGINYNTRTSRAIENRTKRVLIEGSLLPEGNFIMAVMPVDTNKGADGVRTRKEINADVMALVKEYGADAKDFFNSTGANWTRVKSPVLEDMILEYRSGKITNDSPEVEPPKEEVFQEKASPVKTKTQDCTKGEKQKKVSKKKRKEATVKIPVSEYEDLKAAKIKLADVEEEVKKFTKDVEKEVKKIEKKNGKYTLEDAINKITNTYQGTAFVKEFGSLCRKYGVLGPDKEQDELKAGKELARMLEKSYMLTVKLR